MTDQEILNRLKVLPPTVLKFRGCKEWTSRTKTDCFKDSNGRWRLNKYYSVCDPCMQYYTDFVTPIKLDDTTNIFTPSNTLTKRAVENSADLWVSHNKGSIRDLLIPIFTEVDYYKHRAWQLENEIKILKSGNQTAVLGLLCLCFRLHQPRQPDRLDPSEPNYITKKRFQLLELA